LIILKSSDEIERMKVSCRIVAEILQILKKEIKPGVTTMSLNNIAEAEARKRKALPAFKGYSGYRTRSVVPLTKVVHGMPISEYLLKAIY
jgi:methionyl aminopeptidase